MRQRIAPAMPMPPPGASARWDTRPLLLSHISRPSLLLFGFTQRRHEEGRRPFSISPSPPRHSTRQRRHSPRLSSSPLLRSHGTTLLLRSHGTERKPNSRHSLYLRLHPKNSTAAAHIDAGALLLPAAADDQRPRIFLLPSPTAIGDFFLPTAAQNSSCSSYSTPLSFFFLKLNVKEVIIPGINEMNDHEDQKEAAKKSSRESHEAEKVQEKWRKQR